MGRPSKLTEKQWDEVKRRIAAGEKPADLAREYGVSKAAISTRVSKRIETIKGVANQMLSSDRALRSLPVAEQLIALDLYDDMRSTMLNMSKGARLSAANFHRLSAIANNALLKVDDTAPEESADQLKIAAAAQKMANDAASVPMGLLAANKDEVKRLSDESRTVDAAGNPAAPALPADPVEASRVYREFMAG